MYLKQVEKLRITGLVKIKNFSTMFSRGSQTSGIQASLLCRHSYSAVDRHKGWKYHGLSRCWRVGLTNSGFSSCKDEIKDSVYAIDNIPCIDKHIKNLRVLYFYAQVSIGEEAGRKVVFQPQLNV
ncbi:hypothetical protein GJ496_008955 [Pomphorhynchus laevis]|nr:hypothetical protein GJ496_008955 [Pomphorhynchus laevis]